MNRLTRATVALAMAATVGLGAAACGSGTPDVYETPTYFGANGQCYYITDPVEVAVAQARGLCPYGWQPVLMPGWFETRYYPFIQHTYVSYLPPSRSKVVIKQVNNYYGHNEGQIKQAESSYVTRSQQQRRQSTKTYGSTGRGDRAGGGTYSRSSSSSRSSSTRSYSSGGRH